MGRLPAVRAKGSVIGSFRYVFAVTAATVLMVAGSACTPRGLTYTIDPTRGPVGTVISFTGKGCPRNDIGPNGADAVFVFVLRPEGSFGGQEQVPVQSARDGSFTGSIKVPTGATVGRTYDTGISCFGTGDLQGWPENLGYRTFTVTR